MTIIILINTVVITECHNYCLIMSSFYYCGRPDLSDDVTFQKIVFKREKCYFYYIRIIKRKLMISRFIPRRYIIIVVYGLTRSGQRHGLHAKTVVHRNTVEHCTHTHTHDNNIAIYYHAPAPSRDSSRNNIPTRRCVRVETSPRRTEVRTH